jgi:hypothetical protein
MVIYNPTDSRFLTLAQTRTNNGTKDVKLILDTIDKVFYTLDDDGNFDAVDNETAATIVELSVGTLKGDDGSPILLEDSFEKGNGTFDLDNGDRIQIAYSDENGDFSARLFGNGTLIENTFVDVENLITYYNKLTLNTGNNNQLFYEISNEDDGVTNTADFQMNETSILLSINDNLAETSTSITITPTTINLTGLPSFDDDAAASGLTTGDLYITTGDGAAPLDVAGIVMMKL